MVAWARDPPKLGLKHLQKYVQISEQNPILALLCRSQTRIRTATTTIPKSGASEAATGRASVNTTSNWYDIQVNSTDLSDLLAKVV